MSFEPEKSEFHDSTASKLSRKFKWLNLLLTQFSVPSKETNKKNLHCSAHLLECHLQQVLRLMVLINGTILGLSVVKICAMWIDNIRT